MRICIVSGMYPTKRAPQGGVFITRRIEALRNLGIEVDPYALVRCETPAVKHLRLLLGKQTKEEFGETIETDNSSIVYSVIETRIGLLGFVLDYLSNGAYFARKSASRLKASIHGDFDIVHAHWLYPTGYAAVELAKYLNVPVIVTCHGSDVNVLMRGDARLHCIEVMQRADEVEFVSEKLMKTAEAYGGVWKRAHVLPNGICEVHKGTNATRDKLIGFVGNLIPIKRAEYLPTIFRRIHEEIPDASFVIVGDGEMMESLKEETRDLPVTFTGRIPQSDVMEIMQHMKVLILPSRNEGWPCVVLEAHSCGTVVVGSDAGGIPEAIGDDRFVVNEEADEDSFIQHFSERVVDVIEGRIIYEEETLKNRASDYLWINLQSIEKEVYENYVSPR